MKVAGEETSSQDIRKLLHRDPFEKKSSDKNPSDKKPSDKESSDKESSGKGKANEALKTMTETPQPTSSDKESSWKAKANKTPKTVTGTPQPTTYAEKFAATHVATEDRFKVPNKHQILFVVCLNTTLNNTIQQLNRDLQTAAKEKNSPEPIVVRAYSATTDRKIYQHEADMTRLGNPNIPKRPSVIQSDDLESHQDILELDHVRDLMDSFKTHTKMRHGTTDPRLGDVVLSLSYWVLVLTGLLPDVVHEVYTNSRLFIRFRELYRSYSYGEKTDRKLLAEEYKRACRYVINVADVIGATPSIFADERIYLAAHPDLIIIDEAGKVMEMFLLPVFAFFPYCRRFILAGDTRQNRAHQGSLTASNCHFSNQSKVSLLERALICGASRVFQNHQHRQLSSLNKLPNEKWYGNTLTTDPRVDLAPEASLIRNWMKGMFGLETNFIFLDVSNSIATRIGKSPSLVNYQQLRLGVHVIIDILRAHFAPDKVVFMAPYTQQLPLMRRALKDVSQQAAFLTLGLDQVACVSYNTIQGIEAEIVVTTLTITKRIGFLQDGRRLFTEMTRPRFGHIVIGASRDMEQDKRYRGSPLQDVVDFCKENRIRKFVDLDTMGCPQNPPSLIAPLNMRVLA